MNLEKIPGSSGRWSTLYRVRSNSRPNVSYVVAQSQSGSWGCSCPAWTFHTPRHNCKHIESVIRALACSAVSPVQVMPAAELAADVKLSKAVSRFALLD